MEIGDSTTRSKAPIMSAFPRRIRVFTEPVSATEDKQIGPGKTLPDLIRLYYPHAVPTSLQGNFAFLDRDNKERKYDPKKEDQFVFKDFSSLRQFSSEAHRLIKVLCDLWHNLGFPLTKDKDRDVDVPDTHVAWAALDPSHPLHQNLINNRDAIMFIMANVDIMKKSCIVRTVNPGWWAVSYKGKTANNKEFFRTSLNAHKIAINRIMQSDAYYKQLSKLEDDAGDPIDTNPGYPFFSANVDKEGNPITRIKTVQLFEGLCKQANYDWDKLVRLVDDRAGKYGMAGFPLCVGPIRRQQPGYKWQHEFRTTPSGLVTDFDERGVNSQRVAWMVPYVYNLFLTPFQLRLKAIRTLLPGLYHDGDSKVDRLNRLKQMHKNGKLYIAEADYSNYDRFIPVDIIQEIVQFVSEHTKHPDYWNKAAMYLHTDANLVWPDFSTISDGNGWLFKPGVLGLMSGVKVTSETGTLINSVVNAEVLARTKGWNESQLVSYLTQYISASPGSKREYYLVQSDDTLLISDSPSELKSMGDNFMDAVKAAGLKGAVEFGDRFLMRHMQAGSDRPVPARVWQNTLSNESPPEHELVFLAGLASRTDGLMGLKSVDPFKTGETQRITEAEAIFSREVLKSINGFISTAAVRSNTAIRLVTDLIESCPSSNSVSDLTPLAAGKYTKLSEGKLNALTKTRNSIIKALADYELSKMLNTADANRFRQWIYQLHKDRNIPSQNLILSQIMLMDQEIEKSISTIAAKEHSFFLYATKLIGIDFNNP